jgi:peptidase E
MSGTPGPAPIYLLGGGPRSRRVDGDPLLSRVLASCGAAHPSVAYVGAASGDNREFFRMLADYMRDGGAGQVTLAPLAGGRIKIDRTRAIIETADIVFVSGGDVEAGMEVLEERRMVPFLRELHAVGKPFFGLSAGSIMLAMEWVVWDDPTDDATASLFPCMGLAPIVCDTHGEDEGWNELRVLMRLVREGTMGYGITSGAGLCVYPDGAVEALGEPVHCFARSGGRVVRRSDLVPRQ